MNDPDIRPTRIVPPGSTPVRELAHAVAAALTLPNDVTEQAELTYLRAARMRSRVVLFAMRRILADRELDDDDLMTIVATIREQVGDYGGEADPAGPFRVFTEAIIAALTISPCAPEASERAYLQSARARPRRVLLACRRAVQGPYIEDHDLIAAISMLSGGGQAAGDTGGEQEPEMIP
jgi:hypothetical protein